VKVLETKKMMALLLLLIIILAGYLLWPTDESRIRKLIKEGAKAAASGDLDGVMAKISFNYRDDHGMTYLYLKETLKRQFQRLSDISIDYEDLNIAVSQNTALADLDVRVIATAGNETGYIIGDIKTPLPLRFTLEKERTKWLIVKAEGFGDQRMRRSAR
jgi:hypothetical protein